MAGKKRVIFICSRNAARSQMAEGFLRALYGDTYEAASAGLRSSRVSRIAVRVMKEAGIDISTHRSKSIADLGGARFDLVVTLCDEAACVPRALLPPGNEYLHKEFPDPANFRGDEKEILAAYRAIRDQIKSWIGERFGSGESPGKTGLSSPPAPPDLQKT
jgi:arsenate reductase